MSVAYWTYSTDNTTISTLYPGPTTGGTGGSSGGNNYGGGESTGSGDYQKGAHK
jgi:hypothetical protein